jgi:hypothetical protein
MRITTVVELSDTFSRLAESRVGFGQSRLALEYLRTLIAKCNLDAPAREVVDPYQ